MQVYKDSSRAVLAIVSKSGSLYFNHVHLFCLLLSQARDPASASLFSGIFLTSQQLGFQLDVFARVVCCVLPRASRSAFGVVSYFCLSETQKIGHSVRSSFYLYGNHWFYLSGCPYHRTHRNRTMCLKLQTYLHVQWLEFQRITAPWRRGTVAAARAYCSAATSCWR